MRPGNGKAIAAFRGVRAAAIAALVACAACGAHRATPLHGPLAGRSSSEDNRARLEALLRARQAGASIEEYRIAPGDVLSITIYNFRPGGGNFLSDVRVDDRGYLSLPMIAPLRAEGRTLNELRQEVIAALGAGDVMRNPLVSVFLKDFHGQRVVVLGAVASPGLYHLSRGQQTLVDVLSMAGGVTEGAGNYLFLRPAPEGDGGGGGELLQSYAVANAIAPGGGTPQPDANTVIVPLRGSGGEPDASHLTLPVRGGDMIIVPAAGQAFVEGEVHKPGLYPLTHGMTLTQLIATAGGLTFAARGNRVVLVRAARGGQTSHWQIDLDRIRNQEQPDVVLEPNDRIIVPAQPARKVVQGVYRTLTAVVNVAVGGTIPLF